MLAAPANPANLAGASLSVYGAKCSGDALRRRSREMQRVHGSLEFVELGCVRARENEENEVALLDCYSLDLVRPNIVNRKIQPRLPEGSVADCEWLRRVDRRTYLASPLQECAGRLQELCSSFQLRCKLSTNGFYLNQIRGRRDIFRRLLGNKKQRVPIIGGRFCDVLSCRIIVGQKGSAEPEQSLALLRF